MFILYYISTQYIIQLNKYLVYLCSVTNQSREIIFIETKTIHTLEIKEAQCSGNNRSIYTLDNSGVLHSIIFNTLGHKIKANFTF